MKPRTPLLAVLAAVAGFSTAACGADESVPSGAAGDPLLDRGAAVYEQSCASCHGADLQGTDKGPSHLSIIYEPGHHSDDAFRTAIAIGASQHHWPFGDMPPVEGLSGEDVDAVISFVRAEQQRQGFEQ